MQSRKMMSIAITALGVMLLVLTSLTTSQAASKERVLYSFKNDGKDGFGSFAPVVLDAAGNLYGTTRYGGVFNKYFCDIDGTNGGTAFELKRGANGKWLETVLHSFGNGADANCPSSGLVMDASGNLYGTTFLGGTGKSSNCTSCGTVYRLTRGTNGKWQEKVLYSFKSGTDGFYPRGNLLMEKAGNLYGGTYYGGGTACGGIGCGVIFKMTRGVAGKWTEKVLYRFKDAEDGAWPFSGLISDKAGNMYGTAGAGGQYQAGTAFELRRGRNGKWTLQVLYAFGKSRIDAAFPFSLTFGNAGKLYGTAGGGNVQVCGDHGDQSCGTVFEITPNGKGKWTEKVIHDFNPDGTDGFAPQAAVVLDSFGNLYGTTASGGPFNGCGGGGVGCGVVFELMPSGGQWTETILHDFVDNGKDGFEPEGALILDKAGNLYGTTVLGGTNVGCNQESCGTVFELTP